MSGYGHNLDVYGDVYDDVNLSLKADSGTRATRQRRLERGLWRLATALTCGSSRTLCSSTGVSVAVWCSWLSLIPPTARCAQATATNGGCRWSGAKNAATLFVGVDYADGSSEFQSQSLMPEETASIVLQTVLTRTTKRVYGYMNYKMVMENAVFVDKISLSRSRLRQDICAHPYQRGLRNW